MSAPDARYTLSVKERDFVRANARGAEQRLTLALMLKTFRHLGYFPDLSEIPKSISVFIGQQLALPPDTSTLDGPQRKPTPFRYSSNPMSSRSSSSCAQRALPKPIDLTSAHDEKERTREGREGA